MIKKLILTLLATLFLSSPAAILAQSSEVVETFSPTKSPVERFQKRIEQKENAQELRRQWKEESKAEKQEIKSTIKSNRCENVQARVALKKNTYEKISDKHIQSYKNGIERVYKLLTKLKSYDCNVNTANLEAYLSTLEEMMTSLQASRDSLSSTLAEIPLQACSSETGKLPAVSQAKQQLEKLKGQSLNTKKYLVKTIIPEAKSLVSSCRSQLPNESASPSAEFN